MTAKTKTKLEVSASVVIAVAMLAAGVALVGLAVPRVMAGLQAAPALAILEPRARPPLAERSAVELAEADRRLGLAEGWKPDDFAIAQARAVVLGVRAAQASPGERAALLAEARARAAAAVEAAPARSDGWARLLMAEYAVAGLTPTALDALRLSHLTGRHEPQPRRLRLLVGLGHWSDLTPELRELTRRQLDDMWAGGLHAELAFAYARTGAFGRTLVLTHAPDAAARRRVERAARRMMGER